MKTYIRKEIPGFYVDFQEEIDATYWEGMIGETHQDFLDGKWILLTEEQVKFHEENPQASVKEVLDMAIDYKITLESAKAAKLNELDMFDNSSSVNEFIINNELKAWFTPEQRSNYRNSVDSAKLLGVNELSIYINDTLIQIATDKAEKFLASIQLYADQCYIITQQHRAKIQALDTLEQLEAYVFTTGYPEKLNFEL